MRDEGKLTRNPKLKTQSFPFFPLHLFTNPLLTWLEVQFAIG